MSGGLELERGSVNLQVPFTAKPLRKEDAVSVELLSPSRGKRGKGGSRGGEGVNEALASPFTSRKTKPLHSLPSVGIDGVKGEEDDDDVFKHEIEEDKKLVDWVMNVFVPACKSLLEQCSSEPVITSKVQTYLRLLGNTITFFCNEHQSPAVSPSRSMADILEASHSREATPIPEVILSPPSQPSVAKEGQSETSVAMKVLRSVSSSLLPQLLTDSQDGFSEELHRNIVIAIQKISWKVEACLSYSSPNTEYNIHKIIFDGKYCNSGKVSQMMIAAPPEEYKLQNSPAHVSRLGTKSGHTSPSPLRLVHSMGEASSMALPISHAAPSPTLTSAEDYFRPVRRTTVSISKTQVQNLGLNMADVATLESSYPHLHSRSNTIGISTTAKLVQDEGVVGLNAIREKVLRKLAKEFPQLKSEMSQDDSINTLPISSGTIEEPFLASTPNTLSPTHSCGSPTVSSYYKEGTFFPNKDGPLLKERTQSLEFDQLMASAPLSPTGSSSFSHPRSESRMSEPPDKGSSTMPHKRRGTFMKMIKGRKVRSFGRADHKVRNRTPLNPRNKSASEFFSLEKGGGGVSRDPIECYSRGFIPSDSFKRDSIYLNVEVQNKSIIMSPRRRKLSVSGAKVGSRSSLHLDINVTTNFPEFEEQEYSINRSLKSLIVLYDLIAANTTTPGTSNSLPERPDKKSKDWRQQSEDFLSHVSQSIELRSIPEFIDFIKPVSISQLMQKDTEFELLATFFTPTVYGSGDAGTHHHVEVIKDAAAPASVSSSRVMYNHYPSLSNGRGSSVMIERQEGEEETTFIIREGDKDALIISESQNRFLIIAGTFEKLVERLACEEKPDPHYVSTFILGYRHFGSPIDLVSLLIKRFHMTVAPDASDEEVAYAEKWRYVIQLRVLDIFTFWIKTCFPDFLLRQEALDKLRDFIEELKNSDDSNFSSAATVLSSTIHDKLDAYYHRRPISTSSSSQSPSPYHSRSLSSSSKDITCFSAIQLARQLTLIELEYLKAIEVFEVAVYTWETGEETKQFRKNLDAYIGRFNKVSYWVASEILSVSDEKSRASLIEKFIETAKHCQELKNFNTTVSIVTGLSLSSIRRLTKTWKLINERLFKSFTKLKLLVNPANNHQDYRKAISNVSRRDCIPYFGVFMRDVTLCNYGNPKKLKNGLYNFSKLRILVQMFEEIYQYQRSKYYHPSDDRVQAFCTNLWSLDEPELYELSLNLEPREESIGDSD